MICATSATTIYYYMALSPQLGRTVVIDLVAVAFGRDSAAARPSNVTPSTASLRSAVTGHIRRWVVYVERVAAASSNTTSSSDIKASIPH